METKLGLSAEEMIHVFNRMYLDGWERSKEKIDWEKSKISKQLAEGKSVDISPWLLEVLEMTVTAARDSLVLTMFENNEKIYQQLKDAGVKLPDKQ